MTRDRWSMNWLSQSLRNKLIAGSMIAVVAMVLLPVVYAWSSQTQKTSAELVNHTYEVLSTADSLRNMLLNAQNAELGYIASGSAQLRGRFEKVASDLPEILDRLRDEVANTPGQSDRAANLASQIRTWLRESPANLPADKRPDAISSDLASGQHTTMSIREIFTGLDEFVSGERDLLGRRNAENDQARQLNQGVVIFGTCVAIFSFLALSVWLTRSIIDPIQELTGAMESIQEGDLRVRVSARGADELGQLGQGFNSMAGSLQKNARELDKRDIQAGVLQITQVLAASSDLPHLLDQALEQVLEVAHCQAGAVFVRSLEDETLRVLVSIGTGRDMADREVRPGEGIVGRVAQTRVAYFAPADSDEAPLMIEHWLGPRRPAELAYVPLSSGPDLVGVLSLASVEPMDERSKNLLRIVSGQLGAAIRDALSHQTLRRQAVELETRNKMLGAQQQEIERQNRELRVASQLKSEFLANMSHELRTPLTIILGFTNTVLRGAQGPLGDEQKDSLKRVYDNARQLLGLINDILDLSKIEAGQMEIEPAPLDLPLTLDAIVDNFQNLARSKGLDLRIDRAQNLPAQMVSDETRVRQVVMNLVSNAVKFTDQGEVVLSARSAGSGTVEIEVRDTGPGISPEDLPKIFDQFRQLDGRTTRKAGGTGLGLSIVKKLVELLGGTLDVRSQVGQGSTFLVRLPDRMEAGPVQADPEFEHSPTPTPSPTQTRITAPEPRSPSPERGRLVLAIDDDEDFLALLRAAFKNSPFSLRCTSSSREGLELATQLHPDAITLDVMMPGMDGWKVLNDLKANPETADIPVILLSVLQRKGLGLMLGASDYLTKPIDRDHLIRALRQVVPPGLSERGPILVVDDDPDVRRMLDLELREQGFTRIETAVDGIDGLRKAHELRPDMVILDLMMPRMDGFEMAARLQADEATRGIPILVLTAKDLTASDMARLNGSIEEIIQKGAMDVDRLIERLVSILRSLGVKPD